LKNSFLLLSFLFCRILSAQNDSTSRLSSSAYGELYYSYDFSKPVNNEKANFLYNHKRHNEVNANLVLIKFNYIANRFRGNLGLMLGNYAQYNLSSEPNWLQFFYEANFGAKISKKKHLWLDAGILPSHIGFESAISADCWTLTRSLLAENSPYYETGLRLSFTSKNEKLTMAFLVLNGWQKIKMPNYIKTPSAGLQINFKKCEKLVLNYSNFIGTDKPDSLQAIRIFHNLYAQYQPLKKLGFIAGFDLGTDKYNLKRYGAWFSPVLIVQYTVNEKIKMALRGEYYQDAKEILLSTNTPHGFQTTGVSTNVDYSINNKLQFRLEGKMLNSKEAVFTNNALRNYSLTTNLTVRI
jgi:Putative beta-barrel porin-2, OmpL-like. bbp2